MILRQHCVKKCKINEFVQVLDVSSISTCFYMKFVQLLQLMHHMTTVDFYCANIALANWMIV